MEQEDIAYQNKDVTSKVLAENFKGKTFRVYGLDLPQIKQALPTNLPAVKANELRLDNLFELADGSVAVVDYESDYDKADKVKYLNYLAGIASRYLNEKKECPQLRMIVIYTGDVQRSRVSAEYDIGAVQVTVQAAFLSELHTEEIFRRLKEKVEQGQLLADEELMEFMILPLSYRRKEDKEQQVRMAVELAVRIQDRKQQVFTLAGILAFTDKVIDRETVGKIRRAIEMTQAAMIFEEEKQEALARIEKEKQTLVQEIKEKQLEIARIIEEKQEALAQKEKEKQEALIQKEKEKQKMAESEKKTVIRMIKKNYSSEEIVSIVTSYSQDRVEELRREIAGEKQWQES